MKIWRKTAEFKEGKYLVTRRDGTTPEWDHFVLSARDPSAPEALRTYANEMEPISPDAEYVASVRELADDFEAYRAEHGNGDPDAPPHRKDSPAVLKLMRRECDVMALIKLLSAAGSALRSYQYGNTTPELAQEIADAVDELLGPPGSPDR